MLKMFDRIVAARERLRGHAHKTPMMTSRTINRLTGAEIFFKCENLQRGGAFKFRGAFNAISQLGEEERKKRHRDLFLWQPRPGGGAGLSIVGCAGGGRHA